MYMATKYMQKNVELEIPPIPSLAPGRVYGWCLHVKLIDVISLFGVCGKIDVEMLQAP